MTTTFLLLSILGLALTVNAWRPTRSYLVSVPAFFAGWLTSELAPALLAAHVVVVGWFVARGAVAGAAGWTALGLSAAVAAGLAAIIVEALRGRHAVEHALEEALGERYREHLHPERVYPSRIARRPLAMPFWLRHRDVKRVRNVSYGEVRRRNLLDIYHHRDRPSGAPVLVYVHGGAWVNVSNKNHQGKPLMLHMAERGWICVAPNYRLSPRAAFPDHLIDVKRALAWVKEHIHEYGGDPRAIIITGGSAGAHLAALAALTAGDPDTQPGFEDADTTVAGCIPSYGVYDFTPEAADARFAAKRLFFLERIVMKRRYADDPEAFRRASPHHVAGERIPPFFVIHGGNDLLAPVAEARAFVERLRERSSEPVAYAELSRASHAFDVFHSIRTTYVVHAIERFCDWVIARERARHAER